MKFQIMIFFLLLFLHSSAQNRAFFGQSDSCKLFSKEMSKDSVLTLKVIDRCYNLSVIEQVKFENGMYSRNGTYFEFYDTTFKSIKKSGYFLYGMETNIWKEYYTNGKLKHKGSCKIIKVMNSNSKPKQIYVIDIQKQDTTKILFSFKVLDSIKKLTQFNYYQPFESKGYMLPEYYSIKIGEWIYYSEVGKLIKKEMYNSGVLVSTK